jgi:hypothetical protein
MVCDPLISQQSFGRISGGSLRADQSEIRPANILCIFESSERRKIPIGWRAALIDRSNVNQ